MRTAAGRNFPPGRSVFGFGDGDGDSKMRPGNRRIQKESVSKKGFTVEKRIGLEYLKTKDMVFCAMFVALIATGAFIKIPVPVVPFTLQYLFTMLAGLLLGAKKGCLSVCVYIILGLAGLPVFTQGGGPGYIFQPTFGYIIGFAAGAFVTGKIAEGMGTKKAQPGFGRLLAANFIGLGIVYLFGMVYYYLICDLYLGTPIGLWPLFLYCFLLAVPGDLLLCILGAVIGKRMIPLIRSSVI